MIHIQQTNWIVFTGSPASGKTTVLNIIEKLNYKVIYEAARILIDKMLKDGKKLSEIRGNEIRFQELVLNEKIEIEKSLNPNDIYFMDRAIPDSIAYFKIYGIDIKKVITDNCKYKYNKVFIFDRLELKKDYARTENYDTSKKLDALLEDAYSGMGYNVIRVPLFYKDESRSIKKRVNFILDNI